MFITAHYHHQFEMRGSYSDDNIYCNEHNYNHHSENTNKMTKEQVRQLLKWSIVLTCIGLPLAFGFWFGLVVPFNNTKNQIITRTCVAQTFSIAVSNCASQSYCECGGCSLDVPVCQQLYQEHLSGRCCTSTTCCVEECGVKCCSYATNTCWLSWGTCTHMTATLKFEPSMNRDTDNLTRFIDQSCGFNDDSCVSQWKKEFHIVNTNQSLPFTCYDDGTNLLLTEPASETLTASLVGFFIGISFCAVAFILILIVCFKHYCHCNNDHIIQLNDHEYEMN